MPAEPAPNIPITNDEFLQAVFGAHWQDAHVTCFTDPPDAIPQARRGICWAGWKRKTKPVNPGTNTYFCISTFDQVYEDSRYKDVRRKAQFARCHAIVIDDVGTKVPEARVALAPSWELQTSGKSRQAGYIISPPCDDQQLASGLLAAMVKRGLAIDGTDPGMKGVTRYVRLPGGTNNKTAYGPLGYTCHLNDWSPQLVYTIEQVMAAYGITADEARSLGEGIGREGRDASPKDDPVLQQLTEHGLYRQKKANGWHDITCPWVDEHSAEDDSGTGVFVGTEGRYGFQCHHGHCEGRTFADLKAWLAQESPGSMFTVEHAAPEPGSALEKKHWRLTPTTARLDVKPPAVEFTIEKWMQQGKVGLLAAEGGAGKTTLALHMGVCIATGMPFMGQRVKQGPFVLLSRDDDQDDLDAVLAEVCLALGLTAAQRAIVQRDVYNISLRGDSRFLMLRPGERKGWERTLFVPALIEQIRDVKPVAVVFDTVRQFTGIESTDEGGQIVFMSAMHDIAKCGPSVVCLHHVGKQAAREKIVDMYSAIGSSALSDNARFMWRLLKVDPAADGVELPPFTQLKPDQDLLQLISTRGSLRVKQPADLWYTREEFNLMQLNGTPRKLGKDELQEQRTLRMQEAKRAKDEAARAERLAHLREALGQLGATAGRDRVRAFFDKRGWSLDNNTFSELKAIVAEEMEMMK